MQTDYVYDGAIIELPIILDYENAKNLLIFTGHNSFLPFKDAFEKKLEGRKFSYYNDFSTNPKVEEVQKAIDSIDKNFDMIIAIGGGSVIDFAKCYKYAIDNGLSAKECFEKSVKVIKKTKMIGIPTTAGTGSEATQFSVIDVDGSKHSLDDKSILPDYRIVDAEYVKNLPRYLKACCGADALCQAIESYWAVKSNEKSKHYSKRAIALCRDYFEKYVNSDDYFFAEKMSEASYLSGCAINITRTTAAHAISYPLTTKFGIPHGHAVALSIAKLTFYNFANITQENLNDERGIDYVEATMEQLYGLLQTNDIEVYFDKLFNDIGLEMNFKKLGVTNFDEITNSINLNKLSNNPVKLSKKFFSDLFQQ